MKLYGHPQSSCTRKVLFTCAEKSAAIALVTVDLFTGEHKREPHLSRQPFGVIPVLDQDGFRLFESRSIIRYLDRTLPGRRLSPTDPRALARMDQWMSADQSYIAPNTRILAIQRLVRPHAGLATDDAAVAEAEAALGSALAVFDRALRDTQFLAGDQLSLADISLAPYVASLPMIGAQQLVSDLPALGRWWNEIAAMPTWQRAIAPATTSA